MRVHLVGLVHRDANPDWVPDAYVGKLWRLAKMLVDQGHKVFVYGGPHTDTAGTDIVVISDEDRHRWFGDETWENTIYNQFDPLSPPWVAYNSRVVQAIQERIEPHDIIGITMGHTHAAIQQAFPSHVVAEVGVGYEGVMNNTQRCFESYAWMHYVWGKTGITDGRYYDTVIPNAFNPTDYRFETKKDDYLLFMGRLTSRKGLEVVVEIAKRHKVITAGQGEPLEGIEHVGVVSGKEKADLLAGANAVLVPTQYVGPFEGVSVEGMLSGAPAITSSFGCFTETVEPGRSGWRCHTMAEYLAAADEAMAGKIDPRSARYWAMSHYTLDVCAPQYTDWLAQLATLYSSGWYT